MMARRDAAGIGRFFNEEYRAMLAYVRGLVRDAAERDGEDVVQDVMLGSSKPRIPRVPLRTWQRMCTGRSANAWSIYSAAAGSSASLDAVEGPDEGISLLDTLVDAGSIPVRDIDVPMSGAPSSTRSILCRTNSGRRSYSPN